MEGVIVHKTMLYTYPKFIALAPYSTMNANKLIRREFDPLLTME